MRLSLAVKTCSPVDIPLFKRCEVCRSNSLGIKSCGFQGQLQQTNLVGQKRGRCDNGRDGRDSTEEVSALVLSANSGTISQTQTFEQDLRRTLYKAKRPDSTTNIKLSSDSLGQ